MPRAIWTGSISFGLVNIPVRLFTAVREHDAHFHQLAPDGSRIHYKRVSEKSGREVDYRKIRRGYEITRGKFVVFEPGELEELAPKSTKTFDIQDFVALEDIDPISYDRTYYVAPAGDAAAHAYALLAAIMGERQHLAAVRPYGKGLALSTMLFADEIVDQGDIPGVPSRRPSLSPREKKLATQIVDSLASDWDPTRYHDDYEERLREIIRAKSKGKVVEPEVEPPSAPVVDLMDALRASLDERPRRPGAKRARRGTRTRATKAKKQPARKRAARRSA
jgi:DNA end-binding protein Ku